MRFYKFYVIHGLVIEYKPAKKYFFGDPAYFGSIRNEEISKMHVFRLVLPIFSVWSNFFTNKMILRLPNSRKFIQTQKIAEKL